MPTVFWKPLSIALISSVLAACSAPAPAPVERHQPHSQQTRVVTKTKLALDSEKHRVVRGDTLYSIAWRHELDFKTLARWNDLRDPYTIYPGQVLRLQPSKPSYQKPAQKPVKTVARKQPLQKQATKHSPRPASKPAPKVVTKPAVKAASKALNGGKSWHWPLDGRVVKGFKPNSDTNKGIEIAGQQGQSVKAASNGVVVYSGSGLVGYGKLLIIKHNPRYLSAYAHNRRLLVKEGDTVRIGDVVAELGENRERKPILHFEIRKDGKPTNPLRLLPKA